MLSLPATAMGFALSVQISALSWILSTEFGLDIEEVGLVWAAGPIAGILGQVIIGVISDKVWFWNGRRRPFILIGGVLASLMLLALPNIGVISSTMGVDGILGIAILVALTLDLAINVSFNPTRSIIADVTPEGQYRTKGYTWMQTISGSFGVLAYLIGAVWNNYVLIYVGVGLVFLFSVVPTFFIEEPRELDDADDEAQTDAKFSIKETLFSIEPLWGFLIYAVYGLFEQLTDVGLNAKLIAGLGLPETGVLSYPIEIVCLLLTLLFIAKTLIRSELNLSKEQKGVTGFKKVLAAHSFTWIGIQTMFVYMFAYVSDVLPETGDIQMGRVVSISFLVLNLVAAILPAFVLEPLAEKIGRVKTHFISIGLAAAGYAGILFFGTTPLVIYIFMAVVGIGWAATVSLPFAIMSQKVSKSKMGLYMGLFNLSVVLPQLVASLGIGKVVNEADEKSVIFIIATGTLALSAVLWTFVKDDDHEERLNLEGGETSEGIIGAE